MASWRTVQERSLDAKDRVAVRNYLECVRCGTRFELSRKTIGDRARHTCPEKP